MSAGCSGHLIWLLDDSELDLMLGQRLLERCGWVSAVECFDSAAEALSKLQACVEQACAEPPADGAGAAEPPGLILLDINMPGMNGFDFLEALECAPWQAQWAGPVVMLSASPDPTDQERALSHRCVRSYLVKPLALPALEQLELLLTQA